MEERQETLVLLRPPSGEEEVRLVLCRRGETERGLHGWLGEREVWQESAPLPSSSPHISFIRQSLVASLMEPRCWDITVTVSDGARPLPRLVVALAFPLLQGCEDLHEAEALILPDYSIQALSDTLTTLLGKEVGHLEKGLEQALLTLNPLPLHAVGIGACDTAKTNPLPLSTNEVEDAEVAHDEPSSEQVKGHLEESGHEVPDHGMEPEVEEVKDVRDEGPRAHETEVEGKMAASSQGGKERRLRCQICRESFPNLYSLVTHEVETHEGTFQCKKNPDIVFEPVTCYKCKAEMTLSSEVAAHGCTQTKYSPTRCLACKKILVNKLQMTSHLCSPPLPSSQLACLSCGLEFTSLRRTIIHEVEECSNLAREGHNEFRLKVFTCNICDRHFVIKRKFKLHMERHKKDAESASETKATDITAATLSTAADFPDDIENIDPGMRKTPNVVVMEQIDSKETAGCTAAEDCEDGSPETTAHAKEGDFLKAVKQLQELYEGSCTCHHCGKVLASRKATLEHEVNVHGDVSNADTFFRCEFCPKVFKSKALRSAHMSTHTEERRFQCHLCALRFKTVGNLTAHLASCHDPAETGMMKKFSCKFCSKTFRFPAQVKQHGKSLFNLAPDPATRTSPHQREALQLSVLWQRILSEV